MKRVLLTGATGFIGRQALAPLLERGFEVHALAFRNPIKSDLRVIWHAADLSVEVETEEVVRKVQASHLLHFAWHLDPKDYRNSAENSRSQEASFRLLRAFQASGGTRAVLAGSPQEYDPSLRADFLAENAATANHNAYATAKNELRRAAEKFAEEHRMSFAWGRIFNLYGPYEARGRLVPEVINAFLEDRTPTIHAGGLVLDYSYVKDIAASFAALLDSPVNGVVNIASGNPISLRELATKVADIVGKPELAEEVNKKSPEHGPTRVVADITRLLNEVRFSPRYDIESGLKETIDWWKAARLDEA